MPRKPNNPGFVPPREYLRGGLSTPDGSPRPELLTEHAAALGRQLILDGVPANVVPGLVRELDAGARLGADAAAMRARLGELAARPLTMRYALLAQLLTAAASHMKRPADLQALVAHMRRAAMLAAVSQALVGASLVSMKRAQRAQQVRRARPRR